MLKKILLGLVAVLALIAISLIILVNVKYTRTFEAPYPEIKAVNDPAIIEKGKQIVYGPAHCAHCHAPMSEINRVERGEFVALSGGMDFKLPIGNIYAPNITPDEETGIGKFTDQELARSMRYGVKRNGRALFDFMPFYDLSEEDLTAVISFLRSQKPVKNKRPENEFNLLGKAVMSFAIEPMGDGDVPPTPPFDSTAVYGKYLTNSVANCNGCHTERDFMTGAYIGKHLAGGSKMEVMDENFNIVEGKYLLTPNLTTDPETGSLANMTSEGFINRMRAGRAVEGSPMPWGSYKNLSRTELLAIYNYLQTIEPVNNPIPKGVQEGER